MIQLQLFGFSVLYPPARVREDGSSAGLAPGEELAVLVYLANAASPPSRADLARLLWPNSEFSKARPGLRNRMPSEVRLGDSGASGGSSGASRVSSGASGSTRPLAGIIPEIHAPL